MTETSAETGNLTLDINNCPGQGYDGAVSVFGHINGPSADILTINEKAVYTHCHGHRLKLVMAASCSINHVRTVLDQIKELSFFSNFPEPRQKMLHLSIESHASDLLKRRLKSVCCTRWVEQITGLDDFDNLYVSIVFCSESMSVNEGSVYNRKTFYKLITSFEFIATLVFIRSFLDLTLLLPELLQGKEIGRCISSPFFPGKCCSFKTKYCGCVS